MNVRKVMEGWGMERNLWAGRGYRHVMEVGKGMRNEGRDSRGTIGGKGSRREKKKYGTESMGDLKKIIRIISHL